MLAEASESQAIPRETAGAPGSLGGVRGLVLGWCLWLLASWLLTLTVAAAVPAVRWMVYAAMAGMLLVWPVVRLSQATGGRGALGATLVEWVCLNAVFQSVVWPLQLIAGWGLAQTAWLDGAMLAWSLLIGLLIAWGRRVNRGAARTVAMLGCVAVVFGGAAVRPWLGESAGLQWSPIATLWRVTDSPLDFLPGAVSASVLSVGAAAALGWALLAVGAWIAGRARVAGPGVLK